ncbi:MAG: alpha/beta fold hydrolase [Alphaproteobacteria bacterium]|nr:alpha/beta fold hydrolase [Alphaproteobacteria bacterium]
MLRRAVLSLVVVLAACAPRGALVLFPQAAAVGQVETLFVATNRAPDTLNQPGDLRDVTVRYARLEVSVPPDRQAGKITYPDRTPDPKTDFLVSAQSEFPDARAFSSELRRALRGLPADGREAVIYIHGFNNPYAEGVMRLAQLSHDLELPGVAVHFSWPSAANPLGYAYDSESVIFSRDDLERLIDLVRGAGARRVTLVAHSIGSMLAMETLRQIEIARPGDAARKIDGVVLISPDIDVDVFRNQASRIATLPDPFIIFTSRRDRALRLSARLTGLPGRLGNVTDPNELGDLKVTLLDVSAFSEGVGHFAPGSSPALIQILSQISSVDTAFDRDRAGRAGLLPGTVLTVQNVTNIILSPVAPR